MTPTKKQPSSSKTSPVGRVMDPLNPGKEAYVFSSVTDAERADLQSGDSVAIPYRKDDGTIDYIWFDKQ